MDEPIRVVAYDSQWPVKFERERRLLEGAIGRSVVGGVHHVGSTAVPGLEAKQTIDILAGVEDLDGARACFQPLAEVGYLYAPYRPEEMHWFCKPDPSRREFHLHLVQPDSGRFRDELVFRDLLRADPEVAGEYAALKRRLAERFPRNREAYTDAKGDFIRGCVRGRSG